MPKAGKQVLPEVAVNGNVKYPFADLKKVGDYFALKDPKQRHSIFSCVRNYNTKNKKNITVSTKRTKKGVIVIRIK